MAAKDYYQTLGVAPEANADDIKRAYRKLARKYHPDVSKEKDAEARFKEVNAAYEVLSDTDKRAEYDEMRRNPFAGQRNFRGGRAQGGEFEDVDPWSGAAQGFRGGFKFNTGGDAQGFGFEETIRRMFGAGAGPDLDNDGLRVRLALTLEEAFKGTTQEIQLPRKKIRVKVPPGVSNGQVIRANDVDIEIQIAPHPLYSVAGRDLLLTVPLAPYEAALGAKIRVPTMAGFVEVKVPPGQQSGSRLRLRERGLPGGAHWPVGDQYLVFQIVVPTQLSAAERRAYEELAKQSSQHLRDGWGK